MFIQTLHSSQPAGRIGSFGNFFSGFAKSPRVLRSSWILNECNLYCKIVKYCILSEVCMIKTAPHSTVSPQMWCIKSIKGWFTHPQICWQDFVKQTCRTQKIRRPDLFSRPNLLCSRAIRALKCDRRWLLSFGCTYIRLSIRCKIGFTLGLFAHYFSLKLLSLSLKSHMNVL